MQLSTRAVSTAVLAAVVAVAGYFSEATVGGTVLGDLPLTVVAGLLAVGFAFGWPVLVSLPSRPGSTAVVALGGAGAVVIVHLTAGEPPLRDLPVVFAFSILLAFVNELLRGGGRERLVESVSGTVAGTLVAAAAAGWVATQRTPGGEELVIAGALALAVGSAVAALPLKPWLGAGVTVGSALAAGALAGLALPGFDPLAGGLLGVAVGLLVAALHQLFDRLPVLSRLPASVAAIILPVTVTGILVYVAGRVLVG